MDEKTFDFVAERADILSTAPSSKQETKDAANAWKAAVEADPSDAAVEKATIEFIDFLEGRPNTVDGIIAFAEGPAKQMFGEEAAAQMLERTKQRKANGEEYCDCDACSAAVELLERFDRI